MGYRDKDCPLEERVNDALRVMETRPDTTCAYVDAEEFLFRLTIAQMAALSDETLARMTGVSVDEYLALVAAL